MALPAGYYRAANGYVYDADGNGPFSLSDDGTLLEQEDFTRAGLSWHELTN